MMFRAMRRSGQAMPEPECRDFLRAHRRGVLSVLGDGGYPYGVPLDYFYDEDKNRLFFHCARSGHKLDAVRSCDKASFCVLEEGSPIEGHWALRVRSVILFGRVRLAENGEAEEAVRCLGRRFTDDEGYLDREIANSRKNLQGLFFTIEHISGKTVTES